jgi:hypothetical protein
MMPGIGVRVGESRPDLSCDPRRRTKAPTHFTRRPTVPVPKEIDDGPYKHVGTYRISVRTANDAKSSRANVTKTFHAYLELYFQGKHDKKIITYCQSNKIECRTTDGTQVERPKKDSSDIFEFYREKGQIACENASREMTEAWVSEKKAKTNNTVFVRGEKNVIAVQGVAQRDKYGYDVSFWYDGSEVYVTFHCYPKRK